MCQASLTGGGTMHLGGLSKPVLATVAACPLVNVIISHSNGLTSYQELFSLAATRSTGISLV